MTRQAKAGHEQGIRARPGIKGVPGAAEHRLFTAEDMAPSPALLTAAIFTQKYLTRRDLDLIHVKLVVSVFTNSCNI